MRVAYLTHYTELYGANRSLLDLMLQLRDRGLVEPHVLLPREGELTDVLRRENIPFAVVPWQPWFTERRYMGRLHHRIGQYLRYERIARERRATNRALVPALVAKLNEWDVAIMHVNSSAVAVAPLLADWTDIPLIWHIRELPEHQYLFHLDAGRLAYGRALRKADRLIAISEAVEKDIRYYAGDSIKTQRIYNGVLGLAHYEALASNAAERWRGTKPFNFLLAGLFHASKGQEEAVRAMSRIVPTHPHAHLVLAGGGKQDAVRALVAELGLQAHVEFTGFVADMSTLFNKAHVLLMCSRNEAMGRVTVEAMGRGALVIGHASGGTPELLAHGNTGLLYNDGIDELPRLMRQSMDDLDRSRALAEAGRVSAQERFNIEGYAQQVWQVYDTLLSRSA